MYKHLLITRFNLKLDRFPTRDKNQKPTNSDQWLKNRFYYFEEYCLPSVANQSTKEFIWYVLFDNDTPSEYLGKISSYEKKLEQFRPIFLPDGNSETLIATMNSQVNMVRSQNDKYIITTRVDNDDALHRDMIKKVQNQFDYQDNEFLDFCYGLQFDIQNKILVKTFYPNNHFLSRVEKINGEIETVMAVDHNKIEQIGNIKRIKDKRVVLWLEIIHEDNIINEIRNNSICIFNSRLIDAFNIKGQISVLKTFKFYIKLLIIKLHIFIKSLIR